MSMPQTTIGSRLVFQNAVASIRRAGLNPAGAVLSQSYLRLETALVAGQTQFNFDVLVNESTNGTFNTQQKLNLQDAFVASSLGFYLAVPIGSATNAEYKLLTYPTIGLEFGGGLGNFTQATAEDALAFYNGFFSLTINQRVIVPNWDLNRHLYIPQVQNNGVVSATSGSVTAPAAPLHYTADFYDGSEMAQYPVEPNITFVGSKKHQFQVTLPVGVVSVPSNARIVALMRGILAQNVTSVN
jgi:hypothetical protein